MTITTIPVEVCDGAEPVVIFGLIRCGECGHRVKVCGVEPRQTREQPWRAPAELLGRHLAKQTGKAA